jgi:uncharacterized protein (TIGR02588 family)
MGAQSKNFQNTKGKKNILEWVVFAIGLLLVFGILGYLGFKTFTHHTFPPEISVEYKPDATEMAPFRYKVFVENEGGETAEQVSIELVQKRGDSTIEKAELQFAFVPRASKQEGWMNFSEDPKLADTVFVRVVSFKKP